MTDDRVQSVRGAARQYLAKGYQPIPVPAGKKGPRREGWNSIRFGTESVDQYFRTPGNVGLLLGEPSGWLERPRGWLADARTTPAPLADRTNVSVEAQEPIMQVHADPGPFPEHLLNVPGFISEVMGHNKATAIRWQPVLALAGAIALQSVLAGRKVRDGLDRHVDGIEGAKRAYCFERTAG